MSTAAISYTLLIDALYCSAGSLLLAASLRDLSSRTLPNWASIGVASIGIILQLLGGALLASLAASATVFAVAFFCWRRGWMGGGDVKLLAASALLIPPGLVPDLVIFTAFGGGLLAILYLALSRLPAVRRRAAAASPRSNGWLGRVQRIWRIECRRISRRSPLPYGCAIAGAALILMLGPISPLGK